MADDDYLTQEDIWNMLGWVAWRGRHERPTRGVFTVTAPRPGYLLYLVYQYDGTWVGMPWKSR